MPPPAQSIMAREKKGAPSSAPAALGAPAEPAMWAHPTGAQHAHVERLAAEAHAAFSAGDMWAAHLRAREATLWSPAHPGASLVGVQVALWVEGRVRAAVLARDFDAAIRTLIELAPLLSFRHPPHAVPEVIGLLRSLRAQEQARARLGANAYAHARPHQHPRAHAPPADP